MKFIFLAVLISISVIGAAQIQTGAIKLIDTPKKNNSAVTSIVTKPVIRDTSPIKYKNQIKLFYKVPTTVDIRILKGVIKDRSGNPVGNATINIKGKRDAIVTDNNGNFSIRIEKFDKLNVSIVGFTNIDLDPNIPEINSNGFNIQTQQSIVSSQQVSERQATLSVFPVPYPIPSAAYTLESNALAEAKYLYQIDSAIKSGLNKCAYDERKYFYIPKGFALVTQMEQIEDNGKPLPLPDRWSTKIATDFNSPLDYIKALFTTTKGYYRVFVFLYTNIDLNADNQTIDESEARIWLNKGYQDLPNDLKNITITPNHKCTLLVYHFEKQPGTEGQLLIPSTITGKNHFEVSKLADIIK